jgi:hypothetical protein
LGLNKEAERFIERVREPKIFFRRSWSKWNIAGKRKDDLFHLMIEENQFKGIQGLYQTKKCIGTIRPKDTFSLIYT